MTKHAAAFIALGLGALCTCGAISPTLAASKQAEDYFYIRDQVQPATGFGEQDLVQIPDTLDGKTVELRGKINATVDTAVVLRQSSPAIDVTVLFPEGKQLRDYPALGVNYDVRLLCRVHRDLGSNGGRVVLVIPVRENDAVSVDAERERIRKAAEARAKKAAPVRTASRGGSTGVNSAVRAYTSNEVLRKYTDAIRYFNGRLPESTARNIAAYIINYSNRYKLDGRLVMAVVCCESNFNPNAVSRVGAMGLGQLMPGTAGDLGVGNAFSIGENLEGSTRLLKSHILKMKAGDRPDIEAIKLALACYNAGAGAVQKYKGIPPYQETQAYVKKIIRLYWQMLPEGERRGWSPD